MIIQRALLAVLFFAATTSAAETVEAILEKTGIRGGIVVVVGCAQPDRLVGLRRA